MGTIATKWYEFRMGGIPQYNSATNAAGQMVNILDALLVDGFNTLTVDSVVVASNVATVTRSAGSMTGFLNRQVIEIAGATPSSLNGQWRVVQVVSATQIKFSCPGVADGAASGTITIKTPGLGWERAFTGTNKRVYRSLNVNSPGSCYRIDDTPATGSLDTWIRAYGAMSYVDTGTENWCDFSNSGYAQFARLAMVSGTANTPYFAFGDDRTFWLVGPARQANSQAWGIARGFGDYDSFLLNDNRNEFVAATPSSGGYVFFIPAWMAQTRSPEVKARIRQSALGVSGPEFYGVPSPQQASGRDTTGLPWPSTVHNEIVITDCLMREVATGGNPLRGKLRGVFWCCTATPLLDTGQEIQFVDSVVGMEGRSFAVMYNTQAASNTDYSMVAGRVLFDVTGPW